MSNQHDQAPSDITVYTEEFAQRTRPEGGMTASEVTDVIMRESMSRVVRPSSALDELWRRIRTQSRSQ